MTEQPRDHGGNLDAALDAYGGERAGWLDLSTGINPVAYPLPRLSPLAWTTLPDAKAFGRLEAAARRFWSVPASAAVLPIPGASAAIALIPRLMSAGRVHIPQPTYNEHAAAFIAAGWDLTESAPMAQVVVQPNNPDGRLWSAAELTAPLRIIDESFCDVSPDQSLINEAAKLNTIILKSMGKFWGLAGMRLGFAIGDPEIIAKLKEAIGPWQVSGPALEIGAECLTDFPWADETRLRLQSDATRLDDLMTSNEAKLIGGTSLFRLYEVANATAAQHHLAQHRVWSRVFPYADTWLRLGLPHPDRWPQLEAAL